MASTRKSLTALFFLISATPACSDDAESTGIAEGGGTNTEVNPNEGVAGSGNNGSSGAGTNGSGQGTSTGAGAGSAGSGAGSSVSTGSGAGGGGAVAPDVDDDGDGFTESDGDTDDTDPGVNPGAYDPINTDPDGNALPDDQQVDEDGDGQATLPSDNIACDQAFAVNDNDAIHAANAIGICKVASGKSWGILSAQYTTIDGSPLPDALGHGLVSQFGPNVSPLEGSRILALSSGTARQPTDPGYQDVSGYDKNYADSHPAGFPVESPSCPGVTTGAAHDSAALEVKLRVPTNASSFSFKLKFHTYEFPEFICSEFNDIYLTLMTPPPVDVDPLRKNISFDALGNLISVNSALLDVCEAQSAGGKFFTCGGNTNELIGTGFEASAATSWLQTSAPVVPGSEITLRFSTYDSGDGILDSTTLIDNFTWSLLPSDTQTTNACDGGGTTTCDLCVTQEIGAHGCCGSLWSQCTSDAECAGLAGCLSLCTTPLCETGCTNAHPAGIPKFEATRACLYGASAAEVGACGLVCK